MALLPRPLMKLCLILIIFSSCVMLFWYFNADGKLKIRGTMPSRLESDDASIGGIKEPADGKQTIDTDKKQNNNEQQSSNGNKKIDGEVNRTLNNKLKRNRKLHKKWPITTQTSQLPVSKQISEHSSQSVVTIATTSSNTKSQFSLTEKSSNLATITKQEKISTKSELVSSTVVSTASLLTTAASKPTTAELPTTIISTSPTPKAILPTTPVYGESNCSPNRWRPTLLQLFTEWVKIANEHKIEYILYAGTQLGQLRNEDVIPYDSDMDLLLDVKYFPKIKEIASPRGFDNSDGKIRLVVQPEFHINPSTKRKRYNCRGELVSWMTDNCGFQEPLGRVIKGNVHIDLYHLYDHGDTLVDFSEEEKKVYNRTDYYPLRPCKFMGIDATCPNKPFRLLEIYFKHNRFMEPTYKCKGGKWVDKNGRTK